MRRQELAVDPGGILRASVGVMDAAGRRLAQLDRRLERGNGEPGIEGSADG